MTNTNERHKQILTAASEAIAAAGGVEAIDALPQSDRKIVLRQLKIKVYTSTNCTLDTARRNVAKALRQARHPLNAIAQRGGARSNSGPDPWPEAERRHKVSPKLAYGSKEAYKAIAEFLELPGWGHAVDLALVRMVEGDRELKIGLAEMGIIIKANDGKGL